MRHSRSLQKRKKLIITNATLLSLCVGAILLGRASAIDNAIDNIQITVPAACNFSSSTTGGEYAINIAPGNYDTVGDTSFQVFCNDNNGFSVYAIGFSGDEYGNTNLISSLAANPNIATGTQINGSTSNWAMKITPVSGTYSPTISDGTNNTEDFTDFHAVPNSFAKIATFPSMTDATVGSQFKSTYRIYVSPSQAPDSYTGKVKYTLVHPNTYVAGAYTINYNANGGSGTMASSTDIYNFDEFTIPASTYTPPTGYTFAGWCTVQDQTQSPQTTCNGTSYKKKSTISSPVSAAGVLNLYAYWKLPTTLAMAYANAGATQTNGYYALQDMTSSICSSADVEDDELQVIDKRDNKVYWIAKLRDDNCWMTQNLDFDLGTATLTHNSTTLYHDDTDLGWGSDTATTEWTPNRATTNADSNGSFSPWGNMAYDQYSSNPGEWYYAGYDGTNILPSVSVNYLTSPYRRTENGATNVYNSTYTSIYFSDKPFSANGAHGHVGNYYTWTSAIASNRSNSISSDTYADISRNPQNSVCPAGWRLPTITSASPTLTEPDSKNELYRLAHLYANYNGNGNSFNPVGLEGSPLYLTRIGVTISGGVNAAGQVSEYWSSTVKSSEYAYHFEYKPSSIYRGTTNRGLGLSVRCVAR